MLDQALEWLFDKVHGLGFAVAILAALLAWAAAKDDPGKELILTLTIWIATVLLFYVGSVLDRTLYDRLFGTKGLWSSVLDRERAAVRKKFAELGWSINEIQSASRSLFEHTTQWDDHVKLSYEISKACRTFVVPLLLLLIYEIAGWPWGNITRKFRSGPLGHSALIAGLWLLMACLYLALRVVHNKRLYSLVSRAQILGHGSIADNPARVLLIDRIENKQESGVSYQFFCLRLVR